MKPTSIRHLNAVSPPLAGYLRPGWRDGAKLESLISQGLPVGAGIIYDPAILDRTVGLREEAKAAHLERVLDPRTVELSTIGGFGRASIGSLPWAGDRPHVPADLDNAASARTLTDQIAHLALETGASAVLAPTHYIAPHPAWLAVDHTLSVALRSSLDRLGADDMPIYYPLVTTLQVGLSANVGARIIQSLASLVETNVVDAVWLRIHAFGTTSAGPVNLRRYVRFAQQLHSLNVPIVAEKTGTVGLALAGFNAVGGIESSVTYGDRYDHNALTKPPSDGGRIPSPRVYLQEVGALVPKSVALDLLERRGIKGRHQCDAACCPRGVTDTIADPRRHFVVSRADELARLSAIPDLVRPEQYLASWLRPASDRMIQLEKAEPALGAHRARLDRWRTALSTMLERNEVPASASPVPEGRRMRRSA